MYSALNKWMNDDDERPLTARKIAASLCFLLAANIRDCLLNFMLCIINTTDWTWFSTVSPQNAYKRNARISSRNKRYRAGARMNAACAGQGLIGWWDIAHRPLRSDNFSNNVTVWKQRCGRAWKIWWLLRRRRPVKYRIFILPISRPTKSKITISSCRFWYLFDLFNHCFWNFILY